MDRPIVGKEYFIVINDASRGSSRVAIVRWVSPGHNLIEIDSQGRVEVLPITSIIRMEARQ